MNAMTNSAQIQAAQINSQKISKHNQQISGTASGSAFFEILQSMFSSNIIKAEGGSKNYNNFKDSMQTASGNDKISALKNLSGKKDINSAVLSDIANVADENKSITENIKSLKSVKSVSDIVKTILDGETSESIGGIQNIKIDIMQLLQLLGIPVDAVAQIIDDFIDINSNIPDQSANIMSFISLRALSANNITAADSVFVSVGDAAGILSELEVSEEIPEANRQIISELAANLESGVSGTESGANQGAFADSIKESIISAVQAQNSVTQTNQTANPVAAGRIVEILEANNIDVQELQEVKLEVSNENQTQNIRDIISSMRSTKINPAQVSTVTVSEPASFNVVREAVNLVNNSSELSDEFQGQNQALTQMAAQIRQFSTANLNEVITEKFNNANINTNTGGNNINTNNNNELSDSLSGIINVRTGEVIANTSQQQQAVEIRTHIINAANEISDIIARNRTGGNFELKLKLVPEALGEVLVKVTYNRGNINLNIVTENKAAEVQLLNQVENLKESLASHNFNLTEFDIGTKNEFEANYNQQRENANNNRNSQNNLGQTAEDSDDTDDRQNVQRLANLYMNRIMYKTV